MLSVLIPTHNYDVTSLIDTLYKQLVTAQIPFEIIVLEDGSNLDFITLNKRIERHTYTKHLINKTNLGRTETRQKLALLSKYNWLLFLDSDVMPKTDQFISNYLPYTKLQYKAVFGGFAYKAKQPPAEYALRYYYGKNQEEIPASERNKKTYKVIISANFMIQKSTFNSLNLSLNKHKGYGYDNYFGSLLKTNKTPVFHINNEVYHLGIEKSEIYLNKKEQAAQTLLLLLEHNKIQDHDNTLVSLFTFLRKNKLYHTFAYFYSHFHLKMKQNLLGKSPSIKLLQLYRISYMCYTYKHSTL